MSAEKPRVGILGLATRGHADLALKAGGSPRRLELPEAGPKGVALRREWVADQATVFASAVGLDALLVGPCRTGDLAGLLLAAVRLDLPAVFAPGGDDPLSAAAYASGLALPGGDPAAVAVEVARGGGPVPRELLDGFSLANALRAGLAAGGGPELLVHLAALAREIGEIGFTRTIRVLAPETPVFSGPLGRKDLLALLQGDLHDVRAVGGGMLKEGLPGPPDERPAESSRVRFVTGRSSGVEAVAVAPPDVEEVAGECRVFGSQDAAVEAVREARVGSGDLLLVVGCGPLGGPGLLRLDDLGAAMRGAGLDTPVVTDGLPPKGQEEGEVWISLFTPEAADGGLVGQFADGDFLRFDLKRGRIRTNVPAEDLENRKPFMEPGPFGSGYVARYARSALPALDGAGFD